jgi:hypothetical protein
MFNVFKKNQKTEAAARESEKLVAELEKIDKAWPAVEARRLEADKECRAIALELVAAERCKSPEIPRLDTLPLSI